MLGSQKSFGDCNLKLPHHYGQTASTLDPIPVAWKWDNSQTGQDLAATMQKYLRLAIPKLHAHELETIAGSKWVQEMHGLQPNVARSLKLVLPLLPPTMHFDGFQLCMLTSSECT